MPRPKLYNNGPQGVPHPGIILRDEYLRRQSITPYRLAKDTTLPQQRIHEIIHCKRTITAETDHYLSAFFGMKPGLWLELQAAHDLDKVERTQGAKIRAAVTPLPDDYQPRVIENYEEVREEPDEKWEGKSSEEQQRIKRDKLPEAQPQFGIPADEDSVHLL